MNDDREVVREFLLLGPKTPMAGDLLLRVGPCLRMNTSGIISDNPIISWYDKMGALTMQFDSGIYYHYVEKTVQYFKELLDLPAQKFIREDHGFDIHGGLNKRVFKYLLDGTHVEPGVPFIITGPSAVLAYRQHGRYS